MGNGLHRHAVERFAARLEEGQLASETDATNGGIATSVGDEAPTTEPAVVRLSVNIARDSADSIKQTARKKNITVTDATRRAISIMALIDEELEKGHTIQSVGPDGLATRFVFV